MINPFPKFWDISIVFRGAARESKVLGELSKIILNAKDILQITPEPRITKTVTETPSVKVEPVETLVETPNPETSPIKDLVEKLNVESDKTIDKSVLDELGGFNIDEILNTMLGMGIMPQKKEFQYLMLSKVNKDLADKNYNNNMIGEKKSSAPYKFDNYKYNEKIAEILNPYIKERTWLGNFVSNRNFSISNDCEKESSEVLTDLTDMYYQIKESATSESILQQILHMPPSILTLFLALMGGVYGSAPYLMTQEYNKSTEKQALGVVGKMLLVPPLGMSYGLYQRNRMERGVPTSKINQLTAEHPMATGLTAGAMGLAAPSLLKKKLSLGKIKEKFTKLKPPLPIKK